MALTPEIRQLRYLEAVVRLRSFSRAAGELHISQQALSQQIQRMERQLGIPLVERSTRRVEPTAAGDLLAQEALEIIGKAERAVQRAMGVATGASQVRLAYTLTSAARILPLLLGALKMTGSPPHLGTREMYASDIPAALLGETVDLAILPDQELPDGLRSEVLLRDPLVAAVSKDHQLAGQTQVDISTLKDERFQLWPRDMAPGYFDAVVSACREAGFDPEIDATAGGNPVWARIAQGDGIGLIAASQIDSLRPDISVVRLSEPVPRMPMSLASRTAEADSIVLSALRAVAGAVSEVGPARP